jgi:hypothetical protein
MSIVLPTSGSLNWDTPLNADLMSLDQGKSDKTQTARNDLGIFVPPGWGQWWRAARNASTTGKARISVVGGSSSAGYYSSNLRTKGWDGLLRTSLQATYGNGGSGFYSTSLSSTALVARGANSSAQTAYQTAGNLIGQTGTWSIGGSDYGPGSNYIFTSTASATLTFTVTGSTIDIYTVAGGGTHGGWTYAIDGTAAVAVADNGSAQTSIQTTIVSGLSASSHSIVLTYAGSGSNYLAVCGVSGENGAGVILNNFARYGSRAGNFASPGSGTNSTWSGGSDYPADLAIMAFGPNDAVNGDSGDTWSYNLRQYLTGVKDMGSAIGATDVLIMLPHIGTYDASNLRYQDYAVRGRAIAEAYGAAFVDMWTLGRNSWNYWSSLGYWANAGSPGSAGTDQVHPSDAGHQYIANTLLPILTA